MLATRSMTVSAFIAGRSNVELRAVDKKKREFMLCRDGVADSCHAHTIKLVVIAGCRAMFHTLRKEPRSKDRESPAVVQTRGSVEIVSVARNFAYSGPPRVWFPEVPTPRL